MTYVPDADRRALVVIPTYREAENVAHVATAISAAAPGAHVLFVDDSSPDGTAKIVEEVARQLENIHLLSRPAKQGLGPAYIAGFQWGLDRDYDVLIGMDADLSHDPGELREILSLLRTNDLVVGSRYVDGGSIPNWPVHRRALSRWGNRYASTALRLPVRDATSGYRGYRADALERINFASVRANGYGFLIEMIYRAARQGSSIAEVPIVFVDRQRGESKMSAKIILEAMFLVTAWAVRDRLARLASLLGRRHRRRH